MISVSAASGNTVAVGLAYAAGSGVMLLGLALGGRRVIDRLRAVGRGPRVQQALGLVMLLTAAAIITQLDVKRDQFIAEKIPDVNLASPLEHSHAVSARLATLHGKSSKFATAATAPTPVATTAATATATATALPVLGPAPDFTGTQRWFNTAGATPLTLAGLRGRVVLVDLRTYTCINCLRTLPYLKAWDAKYRQAGLTIVGVHTPEFSFEHDAGNVAKAIKSLGIKYPVVQDNNMSTWNAWGNQYWPAEFLIDATGQVREAHFGEGDYAKTEASIRALLAQAGHPSTGSDVRPVGVVTPSAQATPETYLGSARAQGWVPGNPTNGPHIFAVHGGPLALSSFSFGGAWSVAAEQATAGAGARLDAEVQARNIYLVLSPPAGGGQGHVRVLLDGRPAPGGVDVHGGSITVASQRLYTLASLPANGRHRLTLDFSAGTRGFSFTFG